jgi:hypothetical protein
MKKTRRPFWELEEVAGQLLKEGKPLKEAQRKIHLTIIIKEHNLH